MRKRSVPRWSTQPGSDLLETRTLLSTLVIVEHRHDMPPNPGQDLSASGVRFAPSDGPMRGMTHAGRPPGGEGGPGRVSAFEASLGANRSESIGSPLSPPPRPIFTRGFAFRGIPSPGSKPGGESVSIARASSMGAASKLASPDALNPPGSQIQQAVTPKDPSGTNSFPSNGSPSPGPGDEPRHEPARHDEFRPFVGFAAILSEPAPEFTESISAPLAGTALPDDSCVSNVNPLSVPLSLYRINAPNNDPLPPPIALREGAGLIPVLRPAPSAAQDPPPVSVVTRGDRDSSTTPADPASVGESDATIDPVALAGGGLLSPPDAEPEFPQLGIGLITDWIFKDPLLGDRLSLSVSDAEDVIRDQSLLSVAAVLGGLTAVEVGRRIIRRWMSEDAEVEVEFDASWIDGELLREWSGRMSPRFS